MQKHNWKMKQELLSQKNEGKQWHAGGRKLGLIQTKREGIRKRRKQEPLRRSASVQASFLQLGEISEFGNLVDEYVACLKEKLAAVTITPKCHLLFVHVRNFMYQHLFWGLISEQSIEALHAMVNKDERRLASLRNRSEILEKIMQYSFLRNVLFDMEIACEDEEELFQ
uniref:Uncharacterized protein n=1 Tax=Ditylenchus dipsaci TaxID=166011 RepID=A0A915CNZ5_9BILA